MFSVTGKTAITSIPDGARRVDVYFLQSGITSDSVTIPGWSSNLRPVLVGTVGQVRASRDAIGAAGARDAYRACGRSSKFDGASTVICRTGHDDFRPLWNQKLRVLGVLDGDEAT